MNDEQFAEELKRVAARLSEHCDAVQISACRNDAGNTSCFHMGEGNWYARRAWPRSSLNWTQNASAYEQGMGDER